MDLHADSVQGVLFLAPNEPQDDAIKIWSELFPAASPDRFQRSTASPSLDSSAAGEQGGYQVTVAARVGRVDIFLHSPSTMIMGSGRPHRIPHVKIAAQHVADLLKSLVSRRSVIRVALVLDLAKTVARGRENEELKQLLVGFPFPSNATDVSMQFNLRKPLTCAGGVEINRLCVWMTGQIGLFQASPMQLPGVSSFLPFFGVKVDVNTVPETRLVGVELDLVIDEILSESLRIYDNGISELL